MSKGKGVLIIADDYTGACDTGAQFSRHGLSTAVITDPSKLNHALRRFQVVSFNTETRNAPEREARRKVREVLKLAKKNGAGIGILYKKIDSTIRGNIGAELDAIMEDGSYSLCIVAPAFPAKGRTTLRGSQLLKGVPVDKTTFSKDPLSPVRESHIPTLLSHYTKQRIGYISLEVVRRGLETLKEEFKARGHQGERIVVVDAITQRDLETIALASSALDIRLLCGSAGLAEEIPYAFGLARPKPALIVSGSLNPVSLKQIRHLKEQPRTEVLEVLFIENLQRFKLKLLAKEGVEALRRNHHLIVTTTSSNGSMDCSGTTPNSLDTERRKGCVIMKCLGSIVEEILRHQKPSGLILSGGETAFQVLKALGASALILDGEVETGIPIGKVLGGRFEGLKVVVKAGGFGRSESLMEAVRRLEEGAW
ncbi:four-carbon acid sugar kinase family protein [Candidatus Bathyarchaeota archaeon]|nr:four-carbon acid sugar kinase family protein [Candidatus Bathyarchaeota archaeon]MBS7628218.1 four-carbon acid sugar kinase family protein [Candidatus Bathyarchaeota archaeon]